MLNLFVVYVPQSKYRFFFSFFFSITTTSILRKLRIQIQWFYNLSSSTRVWFDVIWCYFIRRFLVVPRSKYRFFFSFFFLLNNVNTNKTQNSRMIQWLYNLSSSTRVWFDVIWCYFIRRFLVVPRSKYRFFFSFFFLLNNVNTNKTQNSKIQWLKNNVSSSCMMYVRPHVWYMKPVVNSSICFSSVN